MSAENAAGDGWLKMVSRMNSVSVAGNDKVHVTTMDCPACAFKVDQCLDR